MYLRIEPREWNMYSVFLYFDEKAPDAEDGDVREYLSERHLEPKRVEKSDLDDREFDVWSYGGCYLGRRHLNAIAEIQGKVVGREQLLTTIHALLKEGPRADARDRVSSMEKGQLEAAVDKLVEEYNRDASFGPDGDGRLHVTLDAAEVQESFLKL